MTLTTLDPKPALIVIDLQKGIVDAFTVHPAGEIVKRSAAWRTHSAAGLSPSCWST